MSVFINGSLQDEKANGTVTIPLNSEYVLRFRNKNNRRAVVKITIDGENVSGGGYIIDANSSIDICRHSDIDRAFKFVALDSKEAKQCGKGGNNFDKSKGTIEARFYLEKQVSYKQNDNYKPWYPIDQYRPYYTPTPWCPPQHPYPDIIRPVYCCTNSINNSASNDIKANCIVRSPSVNSVQDGCTVLGNQTGQRFSSEHIDLEDTFTSLKIYLQGY